MFNCFCPLFVRRSRLTVMCSNSDVYRTSAFDFLCYSYQVQSLKRIRAVLSGNRHCYHYILRNGSISLAYMSVIAFTPAISLTKATLSLLVILKRTALLLDHVISAQEAVPYYAARHCFLVVR